MRRRGRCWQRLEHSLRGPRDSVRARLVPAAMNQALRQAARRLRGHHPAVTNPSSAERLPRRLRVRHPGPHRFERGLSPSWRRGRWNSCSPQECYSGHGLSPSSPQGQSKESSYGQNSPVHSDSAHSETAVNGTGPSMRQGLTSWEPKTRDFRRLAVRWPSAPSLAHHDRHERHDPRRPWSSARRWAPSLPPEFAPVAVAAGPMIHNRWLLLLPGSRPKPRPCGNSSFQ